MILRIERRKGKLLVDEGELQEYMAGKFRQLGSLATNTVAALAMISMIVVLTYFKASDYYYFGLIAIPLLGRSFIGEMVNKWLRNIFKELLET